jgi:hypothetical protein
MEAICSVVRPSVGSPVEPADLEVSLARQPFDDVAVRRELGSLDDDGAAVRASVEGGGGEPIQIDGGRIGDRDLARSRAQHALREDVADGERHLHPPVVPTADQTASTTLPPGRSPVRRKPWSAARASCRRGR